MKAIWRKYFCITANTPISEQVFMTRLTLDACLILLYLFCMAYAAYVLFQSGSVVAV